jgi:hypothetical protein
MSQYYPYCEKCLKQPNAKTLEFYDYRFDKPVCIDCVEKYDLEPEGLTNTCANCKREFSFDDEGGFLWRGLCFCEDCDPEAKDEEVE